MPTVSYTTQRRVDRFRDQRWLIDKVIETVGPEFDQSRLHYYAAPMSADFAGAVLGLDKQIRRWDDLTREFARLPGASSCRRTPRRSRDTRSRPATATSRRP